MRANGEPLSKTGYQIHRQLIVLWGARALYVGPAFGLTPHRNAVAVLAVGIDAPFGVATNPRDLGQGYASCQSALIHPNTLHHLRPAGTMAFLYLDPLSRDFSAVRQRFKQPGDGVAFELHNAAAVIECLVKLRQSQHAWRDARPELVSFLDLQEPQHVDQRIADAITVMRREPSRVIDAADLAGAAKLSVSRFLHLFTETTGVPFRRYRTWCRLGAVVRAAASGTTLTGAAHAAGLASSAHLSATFRDMFGLAPSDLKLQNVQLIETE
jgi:AraC-like DNA-binding protein